MTTKIERPVFEAPRCLFTWPGEFHGAAVDHRCTEPDGHMTPHTCTCGARPKAKARP